MSKGADVSRWKVLIVDDNPAVRQLICQLFTRELDFTVCAEAQNGREAVEKAQEFQPELVVTDFSMPGMNGLEEIYALKRLMPSVPIILYSTYMDSFIEKEGRAAGATAVVAKTDVVAELISTARSVVGRSAA